MERMWLNEADLKYPKQYYVAVNVKWEGNKIFGDIHSVYSDFQEALARKKELQMSETMGRVSVQHGFDDTPQIGGLFKI